jgi:transposase, IS5 family
MIPARRWQMSFADGFIAEQVDDLWEPWMRHPDQALNDDQLLEIMQAAWSKLLQKSKTRGRPGTPAEIILPCC